MSERNEGKLMTETTDRPPAQVHLKAEILAFMREQKSPVWNAGDVLRALFGHRKTSRSPEYRWVLRAMHSLKKDGLLDGENWPGHQNVTIWWLTERLVSGKIEHETP